MNLNLNNASLSRYLNATETLEPAVCQYDVLPMYYSTSSVNINTSSLLIKLLLLPNHSYRIKIAFECSTWLTNISFKVIINKWWLVLSGVFNASCFLEYMLVYTRGVSAMLLNRSSHLRLKHKHFYANIFLRFNYTFFRFMCVTIVILCWALSTAKMQVTYSV